MPNAAIAGTKPLRGMGVAALLLLGTPVFLWGQGAPPVQQARATSEEPFSGVDGSLTRAADALLASAATSSDDQPASDTTHNANLAVLYGPPTPSWTGGPGPAAARVDLLRPAIEPILRNHGIPTDLVAVVLVESGGRATALSPKGARGLWQLMPDTARRYGLRVEENQDERLDLFKATDAAAQYLHDLHAQFGDWKLALAAYNTGEINVSSAILRAHSQDFYQLANLRALPLETRNYVPRVLAAIRSFAPASPLADHHDEAGATAVFASSNR